MAVSIDTVYQKVLAIANKEQRGYITPQDFNLFANQAQMEIFEQYFYDINQYGRLAGNKTEYSDMLDYLEQKISIFEKEDTINFNANGQDYNLLNTTDLYKLGSVFLNDKKCEQVNASELNLINNSNILKPTEKNPIYTLKNFRIKVFPQTQQTISINYIRTPRKVEWTYVEDAENTGVFLHDNSKVKNFQLHISEENTLVLKILKLAGVSINDFELSQVAAQEEIKEIQQEKS